MDAHVISGSSRLTSIASLPAQSFQSNSLGRDLRCVDLHPFSMADVSTANHGIAYIAVGWALTGIAITAICIRLYSRIFVTRSVGLDDYTIIPPIVRLYEPLHGGSCSLDRSCYHLLARYLTRSRSPMAWVDMNSISVPGRFPFC